MNNAAEVLNQDEIDALLKGVDNGAVPLETPTEPGAARDYDLATQVRIVRGRMPTLEMINDRFARLLRIGMYNLIRRSPEVAVAPVSITKFSEYVQTLHVPANINLVKVNPLRGTALFVLDSTLVFANVSVTAGSHVVSTTLPDPSGPFRVAATEHGIVAASWEPDEHAFRAGLETRLGIPVVSIEDVEPDDLISIVPGFRKLGIELEVGESTLRVRPGQELEVVDDLGGQIPKIESGIWPAFPADLTSIAVVAATQATGTVLVFEKMFESRLFFVDKLVSMGARIILCDPHRAVVTGPAQLVGQRLESPDIRAGMAMVIAALCADGRSSIGNIRQIDRGYERIDERLRALGADIERGEL